MIPLLEVENLSIHFDGITAVDNMNVKIDFGEIVGIIGPNGAGKTTFLNLVTGHLKPQEGSIRLKGENIWGNQPHKLTSMGIARSFQTAQIYLELTVLENMLIALAIGSGKLLNWWFPLKEAERTDEAYELLKHLGINKFQDRLVKEIPEGNRKLLDIAMALALKPKILLMDEPTSGVSTEEKFNIMDTLMNVLKQSEVTTVFIEHDMSIIRRYAKRVLVFSEGKVVAEGPPEEVLEAIQVVKGVE